MTAERHESTKTVPEWEYNAETKTFTRADVPRGEAFTVREVAWLRFMRWLFRKGKVFS